MCPVSGAEMWTHDLTRSKMDDHKHAAAPLRSYVPGARCARLGGDDRIRMFWQSAGKFC